MKVVIVGGNASGMSVAARINRKQKDIIINVYEKRDYISFGACGLPYYVGGEFNDINDMIARTPDSYKDTNINVKTRCEVIGVDFSAKTISFIEGGIEKHDEYDELVISSGASPIKLNINGSEKHIVNMSYLNSLEDGEKIREISDDEKIKNIVIIGAGYIGLELTEALSKKQKNITLIEMGNRLLGNVFDEEISKELYEEALKNNVSVKLNTQIKEIEFDNNKKINKIILDNDEIINCDYVITSIGVKPNTGWIDSKLKMIENGAIIVDDYGKANINNVWAVGDCSTIKDYITNKNVYIPLATVARKISRVIADNILGSSTKIYGSLKTSILRFFKYSAVRTGLSENDALKENISYKKTLIIDKDRTNYVSNQNDLKLKIIVDVKTNTIIGAQMLGFGDSIMRIHSLIDMIWNKVEINEKLLQLDLPYSPPFARAIDIIYIAISSLVK